MSDEVKLYINGAEFKGWEGVTITRSIDSIADGFTLSAPFNPDRPGITKTLKPFGYQPTVIKIDDETVLTGTLETLEASMSADDRVLSVGGRSLPGVLVDCAIDGVGYEYKKTSLLIIAKKLCQAFGITPIGLKGQGSQIKLGIGSPTSEATAILTEARANPGDKVGDFLSNLAQASGLLLMSTTQGQLALAKLDVGGSPVAAIIEGDGPTLSVTSSFDGTQRFSNYKILQQQDGKPNGKGTAQDVGVQVYRPTIIVGGDSDLRNLDAGARLQRGLALAGAVSVSATVSGWRTRAGAIWTPGMVVTVKAPGAFLLQESAFVVAEATLSLDASSGRTTALRLVLPTTYTGTMPEVYPWA